MTTSASSSEDDNNNKQKLEQKLGEAIGLEMAAQKAVEELSSKGLLDKGGMKNKLEKMKKEANNHQTKLEGLINKLSSQSSKRGGEGEEQRTGTLNSDNILESATETEQKASQIMQTYLGNEPDSSEAIEFLCLAEAGEVTHYEVLDAMMKKSKFIKNKQQLATQIRSILGQEKKHLQLCTKLAKQNAILQ
jgi:hypothetical protein